MFARFLIFIVGLFIVTLGSSLVIKSNLGASPWEALAVGESNILQLSIGTCAMINGAILIFINAVIQKRKPDFLAMLTMFVTGTFIDFWLIQIFPTFAPQDVIQQIITLLVGILILGFGVGLYLQARFPASPMDTIMMAIHERFGLSLRIPKLISESSALLLAFFIGGAVGIGSIVIALTVGYFVQFFHGKINLFLNQKAIPMAAQPESSTF